MGDERCPHHTIESKSPLNRLEVLLQEPNRTVKLEGNILTIEQSFASNLELTQLIEGVYFGLPALLNVEFADPAITERVDGRIGSIDFRWELQSWRAEYLTTTQEKQELAVASLWEKIGLLSSPQNRRLLAALHYFHVAIRLNRLGVIAGEFLPEIILNLAKVLEVLSPPTGDGQTRDAARRGLSRLGFSFEEVEGYYLPAMALRNEIDVGHVDLSIFKPDQLTLIHGYVASAEQAFPELLNRVLKMVQAGELILENYDQTSSRKEATKIVERLRQYADRYAL